MAKSKNKSSSVSESRQTSAPLTPDELSGYFNEINSLTTSKKAPGGQLFQFARSGTAPVDYKAPTDAQVRGLGGFGATRKADIDRMTREEFDQIAADPSLSVFQNRRSRQLVGAEAATAHDAVNQEIEAQIAQAAFERAQKQYDSKVRNSNLKAEDLALLAEIFFGGKGQRSEGTATSSSKGKGSAFSFNPEQWASFSV